MPIYEYRCENGHQFEVMQRMSDEDISACDECAAPARRVFSPVAIHFKGSGFHNTDYGTRKRQREQAAEGAESKAKKADDKPAEKKTDAKSSGGDSKKPESAAA